MMMAMEAVYINFGGEGFYVHDVFTQYSLQ